MTPSKAERLKAAMAELNEADRACDEAYRAWVAADRKVRVLKAEL